MQRGTKEQHELFELLYPNSDILTGLYTEEVTTIPEASIAMLDRFLSLIPKIAKKSKILIVGSGYGTIAQHIVSTHMCRVDCINLDNVQNAYNQEQILLNGFEKKLYILEATSSAELPVDREFYNIVICQEFASYAEDKQTLLRNIHRTLLPEGRFLISDFVKGDGFKSDANISEKLGHSIPLWDATEIKKILSKNGLQRIYGKNLTDELIEHNAELLKVVDTNSETIESKLGKGKSKAHLEAIQARQGALADDEYNWFFHIYQKMNV